VGPQTYINVANELKSRTFQCVTS